MRTPRWAIVIGAGVVAACSPETSPTDTSPAVQPPSFAISDAAHNAGTPHFFFTDPLVPTPTPTGRFDPTAQPTIAICEWTGSSCGPLVATFTRTDGTGGETIHVDRRAERYFANWNTTRCVSGPCVLDATRTYRIRVLIGGLEAGYADLDVVASKAELDGVDTEQFVPLLRGKPLKIAFRIEEGLVVQPPAPGTITGTVFSPTRGGLSGIAVLFQPGAGTATTDASGTYTMAVMPGDITVSVSAVPAGCTVPGPHTTTLAPGGTSQIDFTVICTLLPPVPVRLDAGVDYACVLRGVQTLCWGSNQYGKLGDGTTVVARATPVPVLGGLTLVHLAVGYNHACGLATNGAAYCWGLNGSGTLGDGTTTSRPTPVAVAGGLFFKQISANDSQTCGVTLDGTAYCWGDNSYGQLGVSWPVFQSTTPIPVATNLRFHSIVAGGVHTCALTDLGAAYCWGQNLAGQLGDGTTTQRFAPVPVEGGLTFVQLVLGDLHTCGRTVTGKAYCWGAGGRLGVGPPPVDYPLPTEVVGGLSFRGLAAGANHGCGITSEESTYCWGNNGYGQAGQTPSDEIQNPVLVSGGPGFEQLAGGGRHTCGLTSTGDAYCWGDNFFGELGNGTASPTPSPTPVQVLFGP
jgi:alpha-tubulin suppressor-like RCC1 family protein